jgi:hypothetical protein
MTSHSRQIVRPTSHIPWSVDVVRLVPKKLKDLKVVASCSSGDWGALTTGDGYIHLWYEPSKSLSEKMMESSKDPIKIFLPDLILSSEPTPQPPPVPPQQQRRRQDIHLALSPSSPGNMDSVHLYVWYAGWLYLKKATTKDFASSSTVTTRVRPHNAKIKVDFVSQHPQQHPQQQEDVTSLTADAGGFLVMSTSAGNLFWVTVTSVPMGLHVQPIKADTGFFSRWFVGGTATGGGNHTRRNTGDDDDDDVKVLPLSATEFLSLATHGAGPLLHWKTTVTVGTGHHATFEIVSKTSFHLGGGGLHNVIVSQAALSTDQKTIHAIVSGRDEGIEKLYWIQADRDGSIRRKEWVNRFAEPSHVHVLGLTVTENGSAYAAFHQRNVVGGIIVMALCPNEEIIQEVELPMQSAPTLWPNMMERDTRTHGCSVMASTGLGLRIRYIPRDIPASAKKARHDATHGMAPLVHSALVSHLRSSFWQAYQDPETHRPLPPSLTTAVPEVLAQAAVTLATELQHKGDSSSSAQNPMEWHRALVTFLQERGLYREIVADGRWQLLSIGQELAVFGYLAHHSHRSIMVDAECKSYGIVDWFLEKQDASNSEWSQLLCGALKAAMQYREENASYLYDVVDMNTPTTRMWLSHPFLQRVIKRQLDEGGHVEAHSVETLARAALLSFSEHYPSKQEYKMIQQSVFALLRSFHLDETAFELAVQYRIFDGLCELAMKHEKQHDASFFSLEPLFETMIDERDVITSYTFAQYVLQWHTDQGHYGHVINYGRHAPKDLDVLMEKDDRLRTYKWIPAIRQSFMDPAVESCLENSSNVSGGSLKEVQWALSMAKLTSMLCATHKKDRLQWIEGKLDLVNAQESLEGSMDGPPKPAEDLIELALGKLTKAGTSIDDRVRFAIDALAVCNAIQDGSASFDYTAQVWAEALRLDEAKWTNWLKTQSDLTSPELKTSMMKDTVFGVLLQECRQEQNMSSVTYGRHIESAVLEKIGNDNTLEFSRLLRSATADPNAYQGQSLIAARY